MEELKNIEVTNLEELQELINTVSELSLKARNTMCTLDETIENIKRWRPEFKEKEEDKIDILNDYMKSLDDRLFVQKDDCGIMLCFYDDDCDYTLCWINSTGGITVSHVGLANYDIFKELLKYRYAFKGKYEELYYE